MELKKIQRKDRNGIQLKDGDIIAECIMGEKIWDEDAEIVERPLGVVVVYNNINLCAHKYLEPKESDCYNIKELRPGKVLIYDDARDFAKEHLRTEGKYGAIHISKYDGVFQAWDNIEVIGSIYDLDK